MTEDDRKELMDLIAEYGTAAIVEGSAGRIRQFKRIVKHVEAIEKAAEARALERAAQRIEPKNEHDDWTEYAKIRAEAAANIRVLVKVDGEQK